MTESADPTEALAVLRELVAMDEYRVWLPEEIYIRASAVLAGAAAPAGDGEPRGCEHLDGPYRRLLAERDELREDYRRLHAEHEQLKEALGLARTEYGGKPISELDEYDRLRLTVNAFQAMHGVLKRSNELLTAARDRVLALCDEADGIPSGGDRPLSTDEIRAALSVPDPEPVAEDELAACRTCAVLPGEPCGGIQYDRRLRSCVEEWPDCSTGDYHPSCCRFPKSCSCTVYDEARIADDALEPLPSWVKGCPRLAVPGPADTTNTED